jgi:lysozyme
MTLTDDQRLWAKETAYQRARKLGIPIPAGVHVFTRRNGHIVGIPFVGSPMRELIRRLQHRAGLPVTGQFDTATLHWLGFSPPAPAHVYGVDVSNHQPSVDYAAVRRSGNLFAWCKATEGLGYVDPYYPRHCKGFRDQGVVVGAYHFARPSSQEGSGVQQAHRFLQIAQPRKGDLLPALDLEVADGVAPAALVRWTSEFLRTVKEQVGSCVLYTYPGFWGSLSNTALFAHYPLWIANYGVRAPSLPNGWSSYAAWQFTSTGSVPGIPGHADRSVTGVALDSLRIK